MAAEKKSLLKIAYWMAGILVALLSIVAPFLGSSDKPGQFNSTISTIYQDGSGNSATIIEPGASPTIINTEKKADRVAVEELKAEAKRMRAKGIAAGVDKKLPEKWVSYDRLLSHGIELIGKGDLSMAKDLLEQATVGYEKSIGVVMSEKIAAHFSRINAAQEEAMAAQKEALQASFEIRDNLNPEEFKEIRTASKKNAIGFLNA